MAVTYSWLVKIYDKNGGYLATLNGTGTPTGSGLYDMMLSFPLNGIDTFSFTIYLDDPQIDPSQGGNAALIEAPDKVIKVWRTVYDDTDGGNVISYQDPSGEPCFSGNVTRIEKNGQVGQMQVLCQNPYWRLQSRFHTLNHYLVVDYADQSGPNSGPPPKPPRPHEGGNEDGEKWDVSALCFRLIDLINHAFDSQAGPSASSTGIVKPLAGPPFWPKTLEIKGGYRAAKGNNVWTEVTELLWAQDVAVLPPDLYPHYINDGTYKQMYFETKVHRGENVSGTVVFEYCTGISNLDDLQEVFEVTPENFANYVWAVGQAGANVAKRAAKNLNGGQYSIADVGVYMFYSDKASFVIKASNPIIQWFADAELKRLNAPPKVYSMAPSPMVKPYYKSYDTGIISGNNTSFWTLGDVVRVRANKGALQVDITQRIYEVVITMSENCVESYSVRIAKDFFGKVAPTS